MIFLSFFSNSLLNFSLYSSILLSLLNIFMVITTNSLLGRLSPLCLILLGLYLVPLFEIYSSVSSFCPMCYFYFYVVGRSVMSPCCGEMALCRRCPLGPSSVLVSGEGHMLWGTLCVACMGPPVLVGTPGCTDRRDQLLAQLAARPSSRAGCWAAAKQGQVLVWLHMELWGRGWGWRRPTGGWVRP